MGLLKGVDWPPAVFKRQTTQASVILVIPAVQHQLSSTLPISHSCLAVTCLAPAAFEFPYPRLLDRFGLRTQGTFSSFYSCPHGSESVLRKLAGDPVFSRASDVPGLGVRGIARYSCRLSSLKELSKADS